MSLMKLFNLKYFLQNLKKSKALILLLLIAVPMFTSIMLLTVESAYVMRFSELSIINIIGMYIIPIVLSMTLFDYVYKKNKHRGETMYYFCSYSCMRKFENKKIAV